MMAIQEHNINMSKVEGLIAFYGLQEWWLSSFDNDEREYIDSRYQPMGAPPHRLTQGTILGRRHPIPEFLNGLNTWFLSSKDSSIAERIHRKLKDVAREQPIVKPGYIEGRHFTTYDRDIEAFKRSGNAEKLDLLLVELVNATEAQSALYDNGVAPAYYSELALLYHKQKEYSKEVSILERFAKQKHAPGFMTAKLLKRLDKAKELAAIQALQS